MKIKLIQLTEENVEACLALQVADSQRQYIASNEASWQAAKENEKIARPFAIYCGQKPVGFALLVLDTAYEDPNDRYWLWRFMIDAHFQGKGYGTAALQAIIQYFKAQGANNIRLSTKESNRAALSLYRKAGFQATGELNGEEIVLQLDL